MMLGSDPVSGLALGVWVLAVNALVGYPAAVAVGISLYLLARREGWNRAWVYLASGVVLGAGAVLVETAMMLVSNPSLAPLENLTAVVAGEVAGGVTATCFWLIARPDRP
jgi:hypothetical protein